MWYNFRIALTESMDAPDRKLHLRIARRKAKVLQLIAKQEAYMATLGPMPDRQQRQKYLQTLSAERNKLYRLKQELSVLESGRLLQEI
jgi:hypothetical protein